MSATIVVDKKMVRAVVGVLNQVREGFPYPLYELRVPEYTIGKGLIVQASYEDPNSGRVVVRTKFSSEANVIIKNLTGVI